MQIHKLFPPGLIDHIFPRVLLVSPCDRSGMLFTVSDSNDDGLVAKQIAFFISVLLHLVHLKCGTLIS